MGSIVFVNCPFSRRPSPSSSRSYCGSLACWFMVESMSMTLMRNHIRRIQYVCLTVNILLWCMFVSCLYVRIFLTASRWDILFSQLHNPQTFFFIFNSFSLFKHLLLSVLRWRHILVAHVAVDLGQVMQLSLNDVSWQCSMMGSPLEHTKFSP